MSAGRLDVGGARERAPFDAFEVSRVREYADPRGGTYCENMTGADAETLAEDEHVAEFWTVYGHEPGTGAVAIADRISEEEAIALRRQMEGPAAVLLARLVVACDWLADKGAPADHVEMRRIRAAIADAERFLLPALPACEACGAPGVGTVGGGAAALFGYCHAHRPCACGAVLVELDGVVSQSDLLPHPAAVAHTRARCWNAAGETEARS